MKYLLLILTFLIIMPTVLADDGTGCPTISPMNAGATADCYAPNIYHNQEILIQEQNQTNHLLAYNYCINYYQTINIHTWFNYGDFNDCLSKALNDTK